MEEQLVQDVSAEELIKLKKKAAKHQASMKKVKNVKDVVVKFDTPKKNIKKSKSDIKTESKTIAEMQEDSGNWLEEFSAMESEIVPSTVKPVKLNRVRTDERFTAEPINSKPRVGKIEESEDLDSEILEELGVIAKPKAERDEPKPVLIFNTKVSKKPISAPVVEAPPVAPLGPRDDINLAYKLPESEQNSEQEIEPPKTEPQKKTKAKFRLKFRSSKKQAEEQPEQTNEIEDDKEVKHMLFEDPLKEAETRAEDYPQSLEPGVVDIDDLDEAEKKLEAEDQQQKQELATEVLLEQKPEPEQPRINKINKKEAIIKLSDETEQNKNPDMIFSPEAQVIRNIQKKESGYSMIATLTEGGFAFSKNSSEANNNSRFSRSSNLAIIEQENKKKALKKYKKQTSWLDIIAVLIVVAAIAWFIYVAVGF
jgi:hypothetical protein